ncbi:CYFA0S07e01640g1_1 [Cyberlindnera fabianii]|uniref:CYFA0S07e01640g1_1 n=1 Tax=Cyberlindnera fabianii TaxID=36022 RepID=A0A061B314_CYBFA|nr:CYFA0S07e01640g1_1 [Cyberlindnera fabianii]
MSYLANADESNKPYKLEIPGQGTLTGYTFKSSITGEDTTIRFAKVPYALPISAKDRFKIAEPIPDDFDYTGDYGQVGLKCPQPSVPNPVFNYKKSPSKEEIQYVNIFIPTGEAPEGGWPVFFYLHGGWLQYNSPNNVLMDTIDFNAQFENKFILVAPGYRLNMFGFLSSGELLEEDPRASNFGFWDQRIALEWTYKYIKHFGGNPDLVTAGGLSAGGYSLFFQLAYELYHPEEKQIIKQAVFQSNLVYCQPKTIEETQSQFDEICAKLGYTGTGAEKLAKLRELDSSFIEDFIPTLSMHTFRAVTDDKFVPSGLIADLHSGEFTKKMIAKDVKLLIGEADNEPWKYSMLNTPTTKEDLKLQVENYYPAKVIEPLLKVYPDLYKFEDDDPDFQEKLRLVFGDITADGQVYASERGFINQLVKFGYPQEKIYRYRISYRAAFNDAIVPKELKVIHALDFTLWFYYMKQYTEEERKVATAWITPLVDFLNFKDDIDGWKATDYTKLNLLTAEGKIEYIEDTYWARGVEIADEVYKAQL